MIDDALGDAWREKVREFSFAWAKRLDDALRDAVAKNRCPQCAAGVHPEAMIVLGLPSRPGKFERRALICCVRCEDAVVAAMRRRGD